MRRNCRCGLFFAQGSRVQTLPRLRAVVSSRATHTMRKIMPCRRPQRTEPGNTAWRPAGSWR
eukprot:2789700-Prymnesium_polylepis.1